MGSRETCAKCPEATTRLMISQEVAKALIEIPQILMVVGLGSSFRPNPPETSDIDLCVVTNSPDLVGAGNVILNQIPRMIVGLGYTPGVGSREIDIDGVDIHTRNDPSTLPPHDHRKEWLSSAKKTGTILKKRGV